MILAHRFPFPSWTGVTIKSSRPSTSTRHASISSMHQLESFLLSLSNADADGRVLISSHPPPPGSMDDKKPIVTLKYLLLNPTDPFKDVVDKVRSVVLAGGTMEPVSGLLLSLPHANSSDLYRRFYSCRSATSISSSSLRSNPLASPISRAAISFRRRTCRRSS